MRYLHFSICLLALLSVVSATSQASLVSAPVGGLNSSALTGTAPTLVVGTLPTFEATSSTFYFQIEVNETGNDPDITLSLSFFHDISLGGDYGGDGSTEDTDLDPAVAANPDFSGTLMNTKNQEGFQWTLSGLTVGDYYGVVIHTLSGQSDGPERYKYSATSLPPAVPEVSSFLLVGLVGLGASLRRRRR